MPLKGRKPELVKPRKPFFMISGKFGIGKSMFCLDFPKPYYIDTEQGATRKQYTSKLIKNEGAYFGRDEGSQDFYTLIEEVKSLATEKHDYKTLVIDSFTHLYLLEASIAEEKIGNDFAKDRKEANRPTRRLFRWLNKLDMTIIIVCHPKDKWTRKGKEIVCEGTTFDGYEKIEADLDLWIEVHKNEGDERFFTVRKTRIDSFKLNSTHILDYSYFSKLYGKDIIEEESKPIVLASEDQISQIISMIEALNIKEDTIERWFKKTDTSSFDEMTNEQIQFYIDNIKNKMEKLK